MNTGQPAAAMVGPGLLNTCREHLQEIELQTLNRTSGAELDPGNDASTGQAQLVPRLIRNDTEPAIFGRVSGAGPDLGQVGP